MERDHHRGNHQPSIFMRLQRIQALKYSSGRRLMVPAGRGKTAERGQAATRVLHGAGRGMSEGKRVFSASEYNMQGSGSSSSPSETRAAHVLCDAGCWCQEVLAVGAPCFTHVTCTRGLLQGIEHPPSSRSHLAAGSGLCTSGGEGPLL